ncbi:D-arabinono-1,4-lactone oxidase [Streptomyces polyrhachis]|uniref:D-arabinono-1,4-lactone oxidase n=1 Tax=Streptomyces polyrhachis TaxID=1282885 RepID=A0ABW2GD95_9ACTN
MLGTVAGRNGSTWSNWAGNVTARPARSVSPSSTEEVAAAVRRAAAEGLTVKAVGTGHSFTPVAATEGLLVRPERLTGILAVDRGAEGGPTVTVAAGTPLKVLNRELAAAGLSLTNMGDIMEQTVSGAVSTGTHGTGRASASIAAQVVGLELVTADGQVLSCSARENAEVFTAARLGLGALGVLTSLTLAVEPLFLLTAREQPMPFDEVTARFDELAGENEHFEFYWFPHTTGCHTKRNNRSPGPAAPLGAVGRWLEEELLSNGVWEVACRVGRAVPAAVPPIARIAAGAWSERTYTDLPYKVFTSPRRVRFVEMEYALPRAAAMDALRELRALIDSSGLRVGFPVEVRTAPADDLPLSTASGRESAYIAVHLYRGTPYEAYFTAVERIMTAYGGRPHWGKLHTRDADYLASVYPRFGEFLAVRERLDPGRVFANDYLRRVLG